MMNDRIQELIKQAMFLEEPDGLFVREVFDKEKFAELIIKECRNVCVKQSNYYAGQGKMRESSAADACNHLIDIAFTEYPTT
jgi:hypothetical protein